MKNTYNFNVDVVTPEKTPREQMLFEKWMPILKMKVISDEQIKEYNKDLLSLKMKTAILLLFTSIAFGQSEIVVGSGSLGSGNFVIGGNIIDTPLLYENKFTKPKATPKPRGKYKKSEAQKLKEALRKVTIKKK
jgi:hypothetical protein